MEGVGAAPRRTPGGGRMITRGSMRGGGGSLTPGRRGYGGANSNDYSLQRGGSGSNLRGGFEGRRGAGGGVRGGRGGGGGGRMISNSDRDLTRTTPRDRTPRDRTPRDRPGSARFARIEDGGERDSFRGGGGGGGYGGRGGGGAGPVRGGGLGGRGGRSMRGMLLFFLVLLFIFFFACLKFNQMIACRYGKILPKKAKMLHLFSFDLEFIACNAIKKKCEMFFFKTKKKNKK